jgi:hypothetical protein
MVAIAPQEDKLRKIIGAHDYLKKTGFSELEHVPIPCQQGK